MIEEVLVVSRRLVLKEEIRVRLVQKKERSRQRVTLRKQELIVSRHPAPLRDPAGTGR
jgi:stress response protein YsnF